MKTTVNLSNFRDAFHKADRNNQFSYDGLELLFNYLEELEQGTGEKMELDVVAICCDFSEDTPEDIAANYGINIEDCQGDEKEIRTVVMEYLQDNTQVIGETSEGTIVYYAF